MLSADNNRWMGTDTVVCGYSEVTRLRDEDRQSRPRVSAWPCRGMLCAGLTYSLSSRRP